MVLSYKRYGAVRTSDFFNIVCSASSVHIYYYVRRYIYVSVNLSFHSKKWFETSEAWYLLADGTVRYRIFFKELVLKSCTSYDYWYNHRSTTILRIKYSCETLDPKASLIPKYGTIPYRSELSINIKSTGTVQLQYIKVM